MNNGIKGRSDFFEKKIKERISIFVPNKTHNLAIETLNKNNFILITGAPGIGKSTLANMLVYQLLADDFKLVYVREIEEAEHSYNEEDKQVFYFDDFLGTITLDLTTPRNADLGMVEFIERIKSDKFKRLILTCRTTILNKATEESEKISNANLDIAKYEVNISDYRPLDKAIILYNHVYFSNLDEKHKAVFFQNQFYWRVINHKHYNPRVIEFFTDKVRISSESDYSNQVIEFLDNPSKIWEKTYDKTISQNARFFLATLYSLGSRYVINEKDLKFCFEKRIEYEVQNSNFAKLPNAFNSTVSELVGAMITRTHVQEKGYSRIEYKFLNPSIEDFLYYRFSKNIDEFFSILSAAVDFRQFSERISSLGTAKDKVIYLGLSEHREKLWQILQQRRTHFSGTALHTNLNYLVLLIRLFPWNHIKQDAFEILGNAEFSNLSWTDHKFLIEVLEYIGQNNLQNEIDISYKDVLLKISSQIDAESLIRNLSDLISRFQFYADIVENSKDADPAFFSEFQANVDMCWKAMFPEFINRTAALFKLTDKKALEIAIDTRKLEARHYNELLKISDSPIFKNHSFDLNVQLEQNMKIAGESQVKIKNVDDDIGVTDPYLEINRYFNYPDIVDDLPF